MKPWHVAIADDFYLTNPEIGRINVWAKTRFGNKSRSKTGWEICSRLKEIPECQELFSETPNGIGVLIFRNHIEILDDNYFS